MGWSNQNVIAQLVIIEGANDALYVYSGAAALGNLIESIVSSSTSTTDTHGNTVLPFHALYDNTLHTAITFDGSQQAAYNSVSAPPGPYTWTKTADILLDGQFVYNTDSAGQPVRFGAGGNLLQYFRAFTNQLFVTAANAGPSTTQLVEVQGTAELEKVIISPTLAAAGTSAILEVQGAAAVTAGGLSVTGGTATDTMTSAGLVSAEDGIALTNQSAPSSVAGQTQVYSDSFTQLHTDRAFQTDVNVETLNLLAPPGAGGAGSKFYSVSGFPQFQSGQNSVGGDTNAYDAARLTMPIAQQTVTSAGATLASMAVKDTVPYQFRGVLPYRGSVSAGTAGFAFTGPSASSETAIYLNALSSAGFGNPGTVTWSINPQSSFGGTFTSPTLSTTDVNVLTVEGIVTFSAAGTLAWTCKANTAGDNIAIFPGWLTVMPVIA